MKNALILPGMPSKKGYYDPSREAQSNEHWLPWLQRKLLLRDILTQAFEWPRPYEPVYKDWLEVFDQFRVDEQSVLIGHSCGGGFLVRWLSENDVRIDKLVLVAPWLDPEKTLSDSFFDFEIDEELDKKADEIHVLFSVDDGGNILESVEMIKESVKGVKCHKFEDYGHFSYKSMGTREFPELLKIVVGE